MLLLIAIIVGSILLDQLTKWLAVAFLQGQESFPLWQDVLHFTYVENRGAAFGMLSDHRWVFMVVSTVAIVALLIYLFAFRPKNLVAQISLAMIVGGGIGNMIDRIRLGYVIDFIDFTLIDFAVFNVADSFVTVGAFLLMGYLIWDTVQETKKGKNALAEGEVQDEVESHDAPSVEAEPVEASPKAQDAPVEETAEVPSQDTEMPQEPSQKDEYDGSQEG